MDSPRQHKCHVCGVDLGSFAPWGDDGMSPSFVICDCCGVEYGYEDCRASGVIAARERWVTGGFQWHYPKLRPVDWVAADQLANIPQDLPAGIDRSTG